MIVIVLVITVRRVTVTLIMMLVVTVPILVAVILPAVGFRLFGLNAGSFWVQGWGIRDVGLC